MAEQETEAGWHAVTGAVVSGLAYVVCHIHYMSAAAV